MPRLPATATACARLLAPSLEKIDRACVSTVPSEMLKLLAIALFDMPRASSSKRDTSRQVSPGAPMCSAITDATGGVDMTTPGANTQHCLLEFFRSHGKQQRGNERTAQTSLASEARAAASLTWLTESLAALLDLNRFVDRNGLPLVHHRNF